MQLLPFHDPAAITRYETHAPARVVWTASTLPEDEKIVRGYLHEVSRVARHAIEKLRQKYPDLISFRG